MKFWSVKCCNMFLKLYSLQLQRCSCDKCTIHKQLIPVSWNQLALGKPQLGMSQGEINKKNLWNKEYRGNIVWNRYNLILELTADSSCMCVFCDFWIILIWSYSVVLDMRCDIQEIFRATPHDKQVMMFSATLSKDIRPICKKFMQDVCPIFFFESMFSGNVIHFVKVVLCYHLKNVEFWDSAQILFGLLHVRNTHVFEWPVCPFNNLRLSTIASIIINQIFTLH